MADNEARVIDRPGFYWEDLGGKAEVWCVSGDLAFGFTSDTELACWRAEDGAYLSEDDGFIQGSFDGCFAICGHYVQGKKKPVMPKRKSVTFVAEHKSQR